MTPTVRRHSRMIDRRSTLLHAGRRTASNRLADSPRAAGALERDDRAAADDLARRVATDEQDAQVALSFTVPWVDEVFSIGDRVRGLRGVDVSLNGVSATARVQPLSWSVVTKRYRFTDTRIETHFELTRIRQSIGA